MEPVCSKLPDPHVGRVDLHVGQSNTATAKAVAALELRPVSAQQRNTATGGRLCLSWPPSQHDHHSTTCISAGINNQAVHWLLRKSTVEESTELSIVQLQHLYSHTVILTVHKKLKAPFIFCLWPNDVIDGLGIYTVKVGFHYPSSRPEFTGVKNAPEFTGRVDGCQKMHQSSRAEFSTRALGP